jgi:hypothetical protein
MSGRSKVLFALRHFGGRTRRGRSASLLQHTEHVLRSGHVEEPLWLDAVRQCVPLHPFRRRAASERLTLLCAGRRRRRGRSRREGRRRSSSQRRVLPCSAVCKSALG